MFLKDLIIKTIVETQFFKKIALRYVLANNLFPNLLVNHSSQEIRDFLLLPNSCSETQLNQDVFALLFNHMSKGFFIEIGANDGFNLSNTIYLEQEFGWDGLLIEANPKYKESLASRKAGHVIAAVLNQKGIFQFRDAGLYGGLEDYLETKHEDRIKDSKIIQVDGDTLENILVANRVPSVVDFISIDVEGGEIEIVKQLCSLDQFRFKCGCIEHNFRKNDYRALSSLLTSAGYSVLWEGQTEHDLFFIDKNH